MGNDYIEGRTEIISDEDKCLYCGAFSPKEDLCAECIEELNETEREFNINFTELDQKYCMTEDERIANEYKEE